MELTPYLFFDGRAEEAAAFYREALGAEILALMRFSDSPDPTPEGMLPPGAEDRIMHMELQIGATRIFVSDGNCGGAPRFEGSALALQTADADEAQRLFEALAEGGRVEMPLMETFFSPRFGMVADRFGVAWMVVTVPADA